MHNSQGFRCGTARTAMRDVAGLALIAATLTASARADALSGWHFPPAGETIENQACKSPQQVGMKAAVIGQLAGCADRWALWRHGYLVHVEGDFHHKRDVASLRKTWHAMTVGAAIQQGKVRSLDEPISRWETDLAGNDAAAAWRHVITQASAFDYPYANWPDYAPGQIWTYSDKNPVRLCGALAKVYGRRDYHDHYEAVLKEAYFDALGMRGWSIGFTRKDDGVRLHLDLEDMGRLGLLVLARGQWNGKQLVPRWFVEQLESKQTYGMLVNYNGPDDGAVGLDPRQFPEAPYGYMTWVNTDGDYYPGASRGWAWGAGAGGNVVLWNYELGVVFAAQGMKRDSAPVKRGPPHVIEANIAGPNPLAADGKRTPRIGIYDRFEAEIVNHREYERPLADVTLDVLFDRPDGKTVKFWGYFDGGRTWKIRFMPDQLGVWRYEAHFSDGAAGSSGEFECIQSDLPGPVTAYRHNPMWFGASRGRPMLIRGLHIGDRFFAANWTESERAKFLDWAQQQGYNLLSIASHYVNRDEPGRGRGWKTPDLWPIDLDNYRRVERVYEELARRGMIVFPFAGFFGRGGNRPETRDEGDMYVRYIVARLGAYWNQLYNVAGPEPLLKAKSFLTWDEANEIGRLIERRNVFRHPLSIHNPTGNDAFRDQPWLTYGVLQGPKTRDRRRLSAGLLENHHPNKPLLAQETLWSGNVNHIRQLGGADYSDDDLRANTVVIHMSAASLAFADNDGNSSSGFSGSLDLNDCRQRRHDVVRRTWDLLETLPYWRLRPRQDLVDRGYCLAEPGETYLVYVETPAPVSAHVQGGPFVVEWINCRQPKERREGGLTRDGRALRPPRGGDHTDWLVLLTRQG